MRAAVCTRYGPPEVLQLEDLEKPVPKSDEVLIRVRAATVMAGDCELRGSKGPLASRLLLRIGFGFRGPRRKVLGQELAGEVESVGKDVKAFKPGDQVFANTGLRFGAYAEYACLPERGHIAIKPANMTFEEAAAVPSGGLYVLPLLRKAEVRVGKKVLIIGAAGTMGTLAVQLCKLSGAEVTGVDSTKKLEMLRSIGADRVVDFTRESYASAGAYDVIFDVTGKGSFSDCVTSLNQGGTYIMGNLGLLRMLRGRWASLRGGKKVISGYTSYRKEDLVFLKGLIEEGKLRCVIDRRYQLERIVEAHRYVDSGQKVGNVVITI